jgi:hypothetical protein
MTLLDTSKEVSLEVNANKTKIFRITGFLDFDHHLAFQKTTFFNWSKNIQITKKRDGHFLTLVRRLV